MTKMDAWLDQVVGCMRDKGWDVEIDYVLNGFGPKGDVTRDQIEAFRRDSNSCREQAGLAPNDKPMTRELAAEIYRFQLGTKACIERHGYSVEEPPSELTFVDEYMSGQPPSWDPYGQVPLTSLTYEQWLDLNETCPQVPEE